MGDSVGPLEAVQWRCNPAAEPWSPPGGCRIVFFDDFPWNVNYGLRLLCRYSYPLG